MRIGKGTWRTVSVLLLSFVVAAEGAQSEPTSSISVSQSTTSVEAYDFIEVTLNVASPRVKNPFTDVMITGSFNRVGGTPIEIKGFCDSTDGTIYRVRFMPSSVGDYSYTVNYHSGEADRQFSGTFKVVDGHRRGPIRVDPAYPWHFIYEGTGKHYFFNGNTAYVINGFQDENVIHAAIDRQHRYKVNRLRIVLPARISKSFWGEPIIPNEKWVSCLNPWPAERPLDPTNPGIDYTRFNVAYWQKFERTLRYARDRDIVVSVILDWGDSTVRPAALSDGEKLYYQYAAERLGAFSNITWDLGDDIDLFRTVEWTHQMGTALVEDWDPNHHLATDHPTLSNEHQDRASAWFGFTSYQYWLRPLHSFMLAERKRQEETGRIIPQTLEEYGYEDQYGPWSTTYPDGASAEGQRRSAWEIYMAGGYQTTGETAKRGTGYWPDTGGGWVNGRGDASMVMLAGYEHIVDFFERFEWWKTNPHDELVNQGDFCLAELGKLYLVYLPTGGEVTVKLEAGTYKANWFNPRSGEWTSLPNVQGPEWKSSAAPDSGDWVLSLKRQ